MIDFKSLLENYHVPHTTRVNRGWVNVQCPFCDDHSMNGGFSEQDGHYNCWLCGGRSGESALQKLLSCTAQEARNLLKEYGDVSNMSSERKIALASDISLPSDTFIKIERDYLVSRRYDPDKLHLSMGVVGGGLFGEWAFRIILPLYYKHRLVSWTGRTILSKKDADENHIPRYKNLAVEKSVINPKDVFFNMDNATKDSVILVEGPFDVLRMKDDCICSFGTTMTPEQIKLLADRYKKVYVMFDNEDAAVAKATHVAENLDSVGIDAYVVNGCKDYDKKDSDELTDDEALDVKRQLGF